MSAIYYFLSFKLSSIFNSIGSLFGAELVRDYSLIRLSLLICRDNF